MGRIYLDYAAATPIDKKVRLAMEPYLGKNFGNPGSLHREGQIASAAVFNSRLKIARALNCDYEEIFFTGSATESNNLALRGVVKSTDIAKPKIIISEIEHESVAAIARYLESDGVEVVRIGIDQNGLINLDELKRAIDERTVLVSVMYANNEIGAIQPIAEIAKIVKDFRDFLAKSRAMEVIYPLLHTDATQAFQYIQCRPDDLGIDLMTLSAHKIYGPKGVGLLYVRNNKINKYKSAANVITPIIIGGGQERGMRSGTENVPFIVGFGVAIEIVESTRLKEAQRVKKLRNYFWGKIKKLKIDLNGSLDNRLPNNLNVYFPDHAAQDVLITLDMNGVAVSSGSACGAHTTEPSKTIMALGYSQERALASLRFSLGRGTTKADLDKTADILSKIIN